MPRGMIGKAIRGAAEGYKQVLPMMMEEKAAARREEALRLRDERQQKFQASQSQLTRAQQDRQFQTTTANAAARDLATEEYRSSVLEFGAQDRASTAEFRVSQLNLNKSQTDAAIAASQSALANSDMELQRNRELLEAGNALRGLDRNSEGYEAASDRFDIALGKNPGAREVVMQTLYDEMGTRIGQSPIRINEDDTYTELRPQGVNPAFDPGSATPSDEEPVPSGGDQNVVQPKSLMRAATSPPPKFNVADSGRGAAGEMNTGPGSDEDVSFDPEFETVLSNLRSSGSDTGPAVQTYIAKTQKEIDNLKTSLGNVNAAGADNTRSSSLTEKIKRLEARLSRYSQI